MSVREHPERLSLGRLVAGVVLLIGLLANLIVYLSAVSDQRDRSVTLLAQDASLIVERMEESVHRSVDRVIATESLFGASADVTRDEFTRFVDSLDLPEGMSSIGYAPLVPARGLEAFEAARQEEDATYEVYELDPSGVKTGVGERGSYFPVSVDHTRQGFSSSEGFDLGSEDIRGTAIAESRQSGEPVLTEFIDLPGDEAAGDTKVILAAHDSTGTFVGVVFASLQVDELLDRLITESFGPTAVFDFVDVTGIGSEAQVPVRESTRWADVVQEQNRLWLFAIDLQGVELADQNVSLVLVFGLLATGLATTLSYVVARFWTTRQQMSRLREVTAAKDSFLAGVGHELRTPLTSVVGFAEILAAGWSSMETDEVDEYLRVIKQGGRDLSELVDELLTIERIVTNTLAIRLTDTDLGVALSQTLSHLNLSDEPRIETKLDVEAALADPLRLRQVLRNLLGNATRYASSVVIVEAKRESGSVDISISNDGPCVSGERRLHLFTTYVEELTPGQPVPIGAGLWISHTLARAMGGDLTYVCEGGLSTFRLSLRAVPNRAPHDDANGCESDRSPADATELSSI